jgi:hypothetical protein
MESGKHYIVIRRPSGPHYHYGLDHTHSGSIKQAQVEVDMLFHFHFREERFWRHDPKKVVKEHCNKYKHTMGIHFSYLGGRRGSLWCLDI